MHNFHYFINTELPQEVSFFSSNYSMLKNTLRLRGFSYETMAEVVARVVLRAQERGFNTEIIHRSRDNAVCGVIVPDISVGVYFESEIFTECENLKNIAVAAFAKVKVTHDKQEEIYIKNTDFNKLDDLAKMTSQMLFSVKKSKKNDLPGNKNHRFFGAATVDGNVNYIPSLTEGLKNRFFIKGRPGTGKSTFLKKLAIDGINMGYDVEVYHCSLDPKSIDMIVVRELSICIFDSTSPHEYFPERYGDGIIDVYGMCVAPGTDEKYSTELDILKQKYEEQIAECRGFFKEYNNAVRENEKKQIYASKAITDRLINDIEKSFF